MTTSSIQTLHAREIPDSRVHSAIEADIKPEDGEQGALQCCTVQRMFLLLF